MNPPDPLNPPSNLIPIQLNFPQTPTINYILPQPQTNYQSYEQTPNFYPGYYPQCPATSSASTGDYLQVPTSYPQAPVYTQQATYGAETCPPSPSTYGSVKEVKTKPRSGAKPKKPPPRVLQSISKDKAETSRDRKKMILEDIKLGRDFFGQIKILETKLKLDKAAHKKDAEKNQEIIKKHLESLISQKRPFAKVHFVESTLSEFDFGKQRRQYIYIANVRKNDETEIVTLNQVKGLLESKLFDYVLLLTSTQVPFIQCLHKETNILCEINVNSKLSIYNSDLIEYYSSLDPKLKSLMIVINFWAECCDLKKSDAIATHALCLMIIFYLQQEPFNLPSVADLQNRSNNKKLVDGWNRNWAPLEDFKFESTPLKDTSILELFTGFLKFYASFDYVEDVVSVYYGKPVKKIDFLNFDELPDCFMNYKISSAQDSSLLLKTNMSLCIQDPFEHCRNLTSSVSLTSIGTFIVVCKGGSNFYIDDESDLLSKFLTHSLDPSNVRKFSFELKKSLDLDCPSKKWFESVKELLLKTIKGVLNCRLKLITDLSAIKIHFPDFNDDQTVDNAVFFCRGLTNIWDNRIEIAQNILASNTEGISAIDLEVAVTSQIILTNHPKTVNIDLYFMIFLKKNPFRVKVIMRASKNCQDFTHISHFVQVKLMKWLKSVEDALRPSNDDIQETKIVIKQEKEEVSAPSDETEKTPEPDQESREDEKEEPESEEVDVPADFFDDFSNQDFMNALEGLGDDMQDLPELPQAESQTSETVQETSHSRDSSPVIFVSETKNDTPSKKKKISPIRLPGIIPNEKLMTNLSPIDLTHNLSPTPNLRKPRAMSAESVWQDAKQSSDSDSRSSVHEKSGSSQSKNWRDDVVSLPKRRDPEKTRRDIIKDKVKTSQSKTEVNIYIKSSVKRLSEDDSREIKIKKTSRRYSRSPSPRRIVGDTKKVFIRRYSRSPVFKKRSLSRSPVLKSGKPVRRYSRSPSPRKWISKFIRSRRRSKSRSVSPLRKKRSRSISPLRKRRSRSISPVRKRRSRSRSLIKRYVPSRRSRSREIPPYKKRSVESKRSKSPRRRSSSQKSDSRLKYSKILSKLPLEEVSDEDIDKCIKKETPAAVSTQPQHTKAEILERSQKVLDTLSRNDMVNANGRLIVKPSNKTLKSEKKSKINIIRFNFTCAKKLPREKTDQYALALNKTLLESDVVKNKIDLNSEEIEKEFSKVVKVFSEMGVQCGTPAVNYNSISTQVDEREFESIGVQVDEEELKNNVEVKEVVVKSECAELDLARVKEECVEDVIDLTESEPVPKDVEIENNDDETVILMLENNEIIEDQEEKESKVEVKQETPTEEPTTSKQKTNSESGVSSKKPKHPLPSKKTKTAYPKEREFKRKPPLLDTPRMQIRQLREYEEETEYEFYEDFDDYLGYYPKRPSYHDLRDVIDNRPEPRMYLSWRPPRTFESSDTYRGRGRGSTFRGRSTRGRHPNASRYRRP